ncbi:sensor histidine kinase [Croceitalea rosinachiae]|uniref:Histidine kinase n=1 Tax=Croceitalea rosinachiae TaxID=3075596 RepID=A0ABU3ACK0_9FLAO|nr:histidine kinase [Croceitalea sp. F388]MDT0607909.1 histidine kinase [Croceitalea sp. F388]
MNITDKKRNLFFWILQFAGWGFINFLSLLLLKNVDVKFVTYSILFGLLISISVTSIFRWYLKRSIDFESFKPKDFIKIGVSFILTCFIFGSLNYLFGYIYIKYGPSLSEEHIKMFKIYDGFWVQAINSLFLVGAWTVTYFVIKLLLKLNSNRIERLELNTNLKQAQLNTLKGQINPHFMFNSLNNIRGLMLEDVDKSREMLTKLSEMLRYSLTKNNNNAIALEEELEMVDNYINLSKIQFENRLEFAKEVQKDCLQVQIPPMIIQLLVENAAKHGISNLKDGGKINLKVDKDDTELQIQVSNTGKLYISKDSTQLGLKNIRQRLKLLYGDSAQFKLEEIANEVVANIKIPLL